MSKVLGKVMEQGVLKLISLLMIFKRFVIGVIVLASSTSFAATDMNAVFGDMLAITPSHSFETQSRIGYQGASGRVYFTPKTANLVSITPPSYRGGCNGIDWNMGGFSSINGPEIEALLQAVLDGAKGYIFEIAIAQLCPICSTILNEIKKYADMAKKLTIDSCATSQRLAKGIEKAVFTNSKIDTEEGVEPDSFAAKLKNTGITARDNIEKAWNKIMGPGSATEGDKKKVESEIGYPVWGLLRTYYGDHLSNPTVADPMIHAIAVLIGSSFGAESRGEFQPTLVSPNLISDVLLCGTDGENYLIGGSDSFVSKYCKDKNIDQLSVRVCAKGDPLVIDLFAPVCEGSIAVPITVYNQDMSIDTPSGAEPFKEGLLVSIHQLLGEGIKDAATTTNPLSAQAQQLLGISPLPLYRVYNLAKVYPGVAQNLVEQNVDLLVYTILKSYGDHVVNMAGVRHENLPVSDIDHSQLNALVSYVSNGLRLIKPLEKSSWVNEMYNRRLAFNRELTRLNEMVLTNVMSSNVNGLSFARGASFK